MGEMSEQPPLDPPAPTLKLPAASVGEPLDAQKINVFFGIGAVVLLVATVAVVVLLAIFVLNLINPR